MKALLCSLGSRGDIEPFLALGEILSARGWEVVYLFPEQFRSTVQQAGGEFRSLGSEFLDLLLKGERSKEITSRHGSIFRRWKNIYSIAIESIAINKEIVAKQQAVLEQENPDYLFFHPKCLLANIWSMKNPQHGIVVYPIPCMFHSVDHHSVIGLGGGGNYGKLINRFSYAAHNLVISFAVYFTTKHYRKSLSGVKCSPARIKKFMRQQLKTLYTISPSLFPKPDYWPENTSVAGFYERDKTINWKPSDALIKFIEKYPKFIFISFGSISNSDPEKTTQTILQVLVKHKIPAILGTSWGGILHQENVPDHIYFVKNIPYDWLFPQVSSVIHHGGSGTTHMAAKYGCAQLIIPHFIDQFFWNRVIAQKKAGPQGPSIKKLNTRNFEAALLNLIENEDYKEQANKIAKQMKFENDLQKLMEFIES